MAQFFEEGSFTFSFPDEWKISRPENSAYFNNSFQNFAGGCKEMDLLAFNPANCDLWLLEVKDYSTNPRMKIGTIWDEVARKVRDVLSLLTASAVMDHSVAPHTEESVGTFARTARAAAVIKVVLHCELPSRQSKLFNKDLDYANIRMKLRQSVWPVHRLAFVTNLAHPGDVAWTATKIVEPRAIV
jgi:hypothetical protein